MQRLEAVGGIGLTTPPGRNYPRPQRQGAIAHKFVPTRAIESPRRWRRLHRCTPKREQHPNGSMSWGIQPLLFNQKLASTLVQHPSVDEVNQ